MILLWPQRSAPWPAQPQRGSLACLAAAFVPLACLVSGARPPSINFKTNYCLGFVSKLYSLGFVQKLKSLGFVSLGFVRLGFVCSGVCLLRGLSVQGSSQYRIDLRMFQEISLPSSHISNTLFQLCWKIHFCILFSGLALSKQLHTSCMPRIGSYVQNNPLLWSCRQPHLLKIWA